MPHTNAQAQKLCVTMGPVTPANIYVHEEKYPVIGDFGFATVVYKDIRHHIACGTAGYQAPEMQMDKGYDQVADIWSVGMVLYVLLLKTDEMPKNIAAKVKNNRGIFKAEGSPSLQVTQVLQACLQVDPELRSPLNDIIVLLEAAKVGAQVAEEGEDVAEQHQVGSTPSTTEDSGEGSSLRQESVSPSTPAIQEEGWVWEAQNGATARLLSPGYATPGSKSKNDVQASSSKDALEENRAEPAQGEDQEVDGDYTKRSPLQELQELKLSSGRSSSSQDGSKTTSVTMKDDEVLKTAFEEVRLVESWFLDNVTCSGRAQRSNS
ncbi:hypothetical protein CYMTET_41940 [Cymbomonas tetramitiformis]|uniref:Protein kinase domain-containing protein n=1 Tax=Cymbomonas tetramitiformis TaxID=36881 RepID=A0AAE0C6E7_9CHLO|nr:hypothetical protein CYMTET_41940 [Cymbomonas tetramitiformis]